MIFQKESSYSGFYSGCLILRMCSQLGTEYDRLNQGQWAWDPQLQAVQGK
jgi:hypothetical protein